MILYRELTLNLKYRLDACLESGSLAPDAERISVLRALSARVEPHVLDDAVAYVRVKAVRS